jgi:hypothetical protein
VQVRVRVDFTNGQGFTVSHILVEGQKILIGSGSGADIQVDADAGVLAKHCLLSLNNGLCRLRDLSEGRVPILVNERPQIDATIEQDAGVRIGHNQIWLSVSGVRSAAQMAQDRPSIVVADPDEQKDLSASKEWNGPNPILQANGARFFEFTPEEFDQNQLMFRLFGKAPAFLVLNSLALGKQPADLGMENLLPREASVHVPGQSLSLIGPLQLAETLETHGEFWAGGLAVGLFPASNDSNDPKPAELQAEVKPYIFWCLRAEALDSTLRNSTSVFTEQFFGHLDLVLYFLPARRCWVAVTNQVELKNYENLKLALASPAGKAPEMSSAS